MTLHKSLGKSKAAECSAAFVAFGWNRSALAEHLLHLVEDAARLRHVVDLQRLAELAHELLLLLGELRRSLHADLDDEIAAAVRVQVRDALAAQAELLAALRAFGDLEGLGAVEGFDFELCSERRLRES